MDSTASRSGYDSTADKAQGQTKKATGAILHDKEMEQEGETQEGAAAAAEGKIMEPWARGQSAEELKDSGSTISASPNAPE